MDQSDHRSLPRRAIDALGAQNLGLLMALVVLAAVIRTQSEHFFSADSLLALGSTVALAGLLASVQTVVIILGGLDISVGSATGFASVTCAMVFMATGSALLGVAAALGVGVCCGLVNGVNIVFGRVNPVIATLATMATYKGLAQLVSDGRAQGYTGTSDFFIFLARGSIAGIPMLIWVFAAIAAALHVLLKYTDIGRNIYAVGGNDTAARLAGIAINKYIIGVYVLSGVICAIAGVLLTARMGSGQPVSGSEGLELESITAAALGGCDLRGGKGAISSTILAILLLGVLSSGMVILGINPFWQNVIKGLLLIAAVVAQKRRSGERRVGIPR